MNITIQDVLIENKTADLWVDINHECVRIGRHGDTGARVRLELCNGRLRLLAWCGKDYLPTVDRYVE